MDIIITITQPQVRAIQAAIPRQNNPAITNEQTYCQNVINIDANQRMQELSGDEIKPLREKWETLTPGQRLAVKAAAGL